ncbi:MAG TPA: TlpA disulfide reductase family protein [Blastocatellia bacterium]|nr:TlpA disulfide reductase family protein [Blastocatellia bacterium]
MTTPKVFPFRRGLGFFLSLCSLIIIVSVFSTCNKKKADPVGVWRGTIRNNSGEEVAFTLEVKREGDGIVGALVNGDDRTVSTSGSFVGDTLKLRYDFYDAELTAVIVGDELGGGFTRQWRKQNLARKFRAARVSSSDDAARAASNPSNSSNPSPDVSGEWVMRVGEEPKVSFWRAAFKQQGSRAKGTIIPVSGDWGEMTGSFENNQLTLNRFDGINCRVFKATLTPQGALEGFVDFGLFDPKRKVVAERLTAENKSSVASLPDPANYTRMKNPAEPFRFSFPDPDGKTISSTDDRFKNKVVIVTITGSWCPNCYDEAPVLQEFYDRYHERGLEVVALSFEYTGDAARDTRQVRAFAKRLGVKYPILYAGAVEDAEKKLSQLDNFGAYPTAIYVGRDGLVKHIHAGFEGKATGERFMRLKAKMEALIEDMLEPTRGG